MQSILPGKRKGFESGELRNGYRTGATARGVALSAMGLALRAWSAEG